MDLGGLELTYRQLLSKKGIPEFIFNVTFYPISLLNSIYSTSRRFIYSAGIKRKFNFKKPIISVGNLNIGGSGKTPLVIYIAQNIMDHGYKPAVVIGKEAIEDEVLIYKTQLPDIPIFVENNKIDSIKRASDSDCDVIIIDDGFQLLGINKNLDIVIIRDDVLSLPFPLGFGREGKSALNYADLIIISKPYRGLSKKYIKNKMKHIFIMRQVPTEIVNYSSNKSVEINILTGENILLFSMVPSIEYIAYELSKFGLNVKIMQFPDHYRYKSSDINSIMLRKNLVKYIITTEKDISRITKDFPDMLGSLWILESKLCIEDENTLIEPIIRLIENYEKV
jgi:tetraacyldisaccharide 4'-kinase